MGCHFLRGWDIPLWLSGKKKPTCNVEDVDSILGLGRAPGEGNGNPLQCSYNPWTEEPGRLQSMGSKELDMTEGLNAHMLQTIFLTQGSNPPSPVFLALASIFFTTESPGKPPISGRAGIKSKCRHPRQSFGTIYCICVNP